MVRSLDEFLVGKHVIAGTGSRSLITESVEHQSSVFNTLYFRVLDLTMSAVKPVVLMSGMAEGFDEYMCRVASELDLPYVCCIPTRSYGSYYWGKTSLTGENRFAVFESYVADADYHEFVMDKLYDDEGLHANFVRNQRMVDLATEFVAYDVTSRGTKDCIHRIKIARKPFYIVGEKPEC